MTDGLLTVESIPEYLAADPLLCAHIDSTRIRSVTEVGDGNLNLVFIVKDDDGRGIVLKQALPYVRMVGPEWPLSPERACHESNALSRHGALTPDLVPHLYAFDADRYILAMEDLSDHLVWRTALNDGLRHERVATRMGEYVAALAFGTSILSVDPQVQKERVATSINSELRAITEDLVFTEPYADIGRNSVLPANEADATALSNDAVMVRAMGRAKWTFSTSGEALIHGDLHTGSVMVRSGTDDDLRVDSAKAFDCEFSFYGPVAFDLGALWANYTLAAARAMALGDDDRAGWCLALCSQTWRSFETSIRTSWPDRRDARIFSDDFGEDLIARWRSETWLFAAAEMARRIVGLAKASDIESLPEDLRVGAARGVLYVARAAVRIGADHDDPATFVTMAAKTLREAAVR